MVGVSPLMLLNVLIRFLTDKWTVIVYIMLAFIAVLYITRVPLKQHLTLLAKDMASNEIAEIEEESAISVNRKLGGIDTVNADNLLTGINSSPQPLVFQTRHLGRLPSKSSDSTTSDLATDPQSVWHKYSGDQPFPSTITTLPNITATSTTATTATATATATTSANIEDFTSTPNPGRSTPSPVLQVYYRMTCPHTQALLPIWYEVVAALPLKTGAIRYDEINCEDANDKCQAAKIDGVPTIRLVKYNPDGSQASTEEHTGPRTFDDIQRWLSGHGIALVPSLKVNVIDNSMDATGTDGISEGFSGMDGGGARIGHGNGGSDIGNQILDATGNLRKKFDNAYLTAAAIDEHDHHYDVSDGCYDATFSRCQQNSRNPGFQIFTHRGQWGCVRPEPGTGESIFKYITANASV